MNEIHILAGEIIMDDMIHSRAGFLVFQEGNKKHPDGRIISILDNVEVAREQFPQSTFTQLPTGAVIMPAFHDAHNHWGFAAFSMGVSLAGIANPQTAQAKLKALVDRMPTGWLLGWGWNSAHLPSLTSEHLDAVTMNRPLIVFDKSTHGVLLNSVAERIIEPLWTAARQRGEQIQLMEHRLIEGSHLIYRILELDESSLRHALVERQRAFLESGIASLDDMDVFSPQLLRVLSCLYADGELFLPCRAYVDLGRFDDPRVAVPMSIGKLELVGMKAYADGALGARSAALFDPFLGGGDRGLRLLNPNTLLERWRMASDRGFKRLAIHAIGDQGVSDALDCFEAVQSASPQLPGEAFRIEHAQLVRPSDLVRCRNLGIALCMQPNFISDIDDYQDRLGPQIHRLSQHQSIIKSGVRMAFGSDGMPTGPLHGIRCAMNHPNPQERISAQESIRAYIHESHRISGSEHHAGRLARGFRADLTILDRRLESAEDARTAQILATFVGGRCAYRADVPKGLISVSS